VAPSTHQFLSIDLPPILTALFTSLACALLGNFLVLRRLSLMGDAISHAVLPGLVISFLITGARSPLPMFLGAAVAGVLTVVIVEAIRKLGRMESGAAMGVTFSILFALGVLLLEQAAARQVDLDPDCVLHGMLESIFWFPPEQWGGFFSLDTLALLPRQLLTSAAVALASLALIALLFKELRLAAFDPALASALGFNASALHYLLMIFVAASTVAAFEAVGSILVIAMLIGPPAAARLLTDRLSTQIFLSAVIASLTTLAGYFTAAFALQSVGYDFSLSATGMMALFIGLALALAILLSPSQGLIARAHRRVRLAIDIAREDLLGLLYRFEEQPIAGKHATASAVGRSEFTEGATASDRIFEGVGRGEPVQPWASPLVPDLLRSLPSPRLARRALRDALRRHELTISNNRAALTDQGRRAAAAIIRSHRLWESYLVGEAGLRADHVHDSAMRLEHLTESALNQRLNRLRPPSNTDPQGKPIPQ
jgi:manganese/zinc/iron transport system permease protein